MVYDLERLMAQTHPGERRCGTRRPEGRVTEAYVDQSRGTSTTCSASSPVASALLFVTRKSPVAAALWLVSTMFAIAGMYVLLDAQFVGRVQVLGLRRRDHGRVPVRGHAPQPRATATPWPTCSATACASVPARWGSRSSRCCSRPWPGTGRCSASRSRRRRRDAGNVVAPVAAVLFREQLLAFEITSVLLLAAVVGAVVLAKRRTAP
jgi:NADH-quinone oxidoreductase subunit J